MTDHVTGRDLREALRHLIVSYGVLDASTRPCGTAISTPHAWALLELHARGAISVKELASCLQIDRTNVSRLVARMEEAGELQRVRNPDDGRAWLLTLTKKGSRAAAALDETSSQHFTSLVQQLDHPHNIIDALNQLSRSFRDFEKDKR